MLDIKKYVKVQSLEEAYELCQNRKNIIIGGMLWLKMQNRSVDTAIDLCDLNLNHIEDKGDEIHIGAMVTLRQLESNPILHQYTHGAMKESVHNIVGVQFRNLATVGGSLFGRYGFSDVLTMFMALFCFLLSFFVCLFVLFCFVFLLLFLFFVFVFVFFSLSSQARKGSVVKVFTFE